MNEIKRREIADILDKMQFFQGQRAGRELWFDKPTEVQEQDCENFTRDIRMIRDYILQLEEQAKPKWIPVSERFPEKPGFYIVTGAWIGQPREIWMCELWILESFGAGWCNDARRPVIDAWMPLPEPYKGELANEA